ncbi:hypothetical protein FGIG_05972 [Fasciola gigantica]|uniref:Death domain-containing protein n=1 Tax=Fasciola gigantica TaxID=46835 RepID=A0A504YRI5_FASGI|nr:hypothetical protein FGIG_05972 [Fasciola gigantica]
MQRVQSVKASPSTLRKIAHNIKIRAFPKDLNSALNLKLERKKFVQVAGSEEICEEKNLLRAMRLVARHIGSDWRALFYNLPFEPVKGIAELEDILQHLGQIMSRADQSELTLAALRLWHRQTFYANPVMLHDTLKRIGRTALAERIARVLKFPALNPLPPPCKQQSVDREFARKPNKTELTIVCSIACNPTHSRSTRGRI